MKISYNWLKEYLDFSQAPEEVGDILTNIGLEVEEISKWESVKGGLEGLKIGVVREVQKHPDADKLSVTKVNIGDAGDLQIVCGAPNVAAGQKVIVATDGTTIHPFSDEPFKIKKTKIRGIESHGMICAEDEIGLSNDHGGIMVLKEDAEVGTLAKDYLKVETDFIFEIGFTPNRGDAMSQIGTARDLAAYLVANQNQNASLHIPDVSTFSVDDHSFRIDVTVENTEACPRYSGVTVTGIEVRESPQWLQNKLKSVGLRPVNNIVDITNFVMYECGQPLHAFDGDEISGKKIVVKTLPEHALFKTLDDKEIKLSADDLMICHATEGMCIAGVYGGKKSGVKKTTRNIFLESACFNPKFIRRTSTRHLLRTDAAIRFEKGTDPGNTLYALKRAAILIREICGGKISSEIVDVYPEPVKEKIISLTREKLHRVAGTEIREEDAGKILQALQFKILTEDSDQITVASPVFKTDVTMAEDVIEEILRIYGLDKIPVPGTVRSSLSFLSDDQHEDLQHTVSQMLSGSGFREMINNSISNSKFHETYFPGMENEVVKLLSFSNVGLDSMRTSMLFPALEVISHNHNRRQTDLRLFEFGKTYRQENDSYKESSHLILLSTGNRFSESWQVKAQPADFYFLKGMVENIFRRSGISGYTGSSISNSILQTGLIYSSGNDPLVTLGKVHPKIITEFGIKRDVWYADFDFDTMVKCCRNTTTYSEPSKFPAVRRDLALVIDQKISFAEIETLAYKTCGSLLKALNLFDVYQDEKLGDNKKSYAVSFTFEDREKTLTDKEVESNMEKLIRTFEKELGASIRK